MGSALSSAAPLADWPNAAVAAKKQITNSVVFIRLVSHFMRLQLRKLESIDNSLTTCHPVETSLQRALWLYASSIPNLVLRHLEFPEVNKASRATICTFVGGSLEWEQS